MLEAGDAFCKVHYFGRSIRQVSRVYFFAMGVHVLVQVSTQCLYHLGEWNFKSDFVWKDAGHLNTHQTFYSHPNKSMISRNHEPLISWSECVFQTSLPIFTPSILKSQIFIGSLQSHGIPCTVSTAVQCYWICNYQNLQEKRLCDFKLAHCCKVNKRSLLRCKSFMA